MSCLYIYMYMRFEVVQTTRCLRVVHALSGTKYLVSSFLYGTLPVRDTLPTRLLPSATALLSTPSNCPPRCRPLWPYQSRLPDPSGLPVQFPPFSLYTSMDPCPVAPPPQPHGGCTTASSGGPACGLRAILLHEHVPIGGEHAQEQRGLHGGYTAAADK
jgi:hypothetical protein